MTADLTIRRAAAELDVSPETVHRLIRAQSLAAYRISGPRSPLRVTQQALVDYREQQRARADDPWVRSRDRRTA